MTILPTEGSGNYPFIRPQLRDDMVARPRDASAAPLRMKRDQVAVSIARLGLIDGDSDKDNYASQRDDHPISKADED